MRAVPVSALILGVALVAGCKPDPHRPDAGPLPPDAYRPDAPPPYWVPVQGQAYNWDIQLAETPFNVSMARDIYMIDLWDAVPTPRMIDYSDYPVDNTPVMVPAGAHASAIATIHATTDAKVICHVSTGAIHLDDPDAKKFPGYEANPPNRPTPPAANSVIGWSTTPADMKERFISIADGTKRADVLKLIGKRLLLAKQIGCDSIVARWNDQIAYYSSPGTGFMGGTTDDYRSWATALVENARQRQISTGLRAESAEGIDATSSIYDWLLYEKCAVDDMCNNVKPYIDARKPVFEIEYPADPTNPGILCTRVKAAGIINGIAKDAALSNMPYARCM